MCLLDNREVRKGWQPLKEAMLGLFKKHGAEILSGRRWDERRLAYSIKGQNRGTYLLVYFAADTQTLTAIRRDLQFSEALLRYLLVECPEVPESAFEPETDFDVNSIPTDDSVSAPVSAPAEPEGEAEPATATATATESDDDNQTDSKES
jgi:small subunit ribosomal protein S6